MAQVESTPPSLEEAARKVGAAIEAHAGVVSDDPNDVLRVIEAGDVLRRAVLDYETILMDSSGWSNPIRHLGRLPMFSEDFDESNAGDAYDAEWTVRVTATYELSVADEELLNNLVEGRGGERPSTVAGAVRFLFEADSWDVQQYPSARIRLARAELQVPVDNAP